MAARNIKFIYFFTAKDDCCPEKTWFSESTEGWTFRFHISSIESSSSLLLYSRSSCSSSILLSTLSFTYWIIQLVSANTQLYMAHLENRRRPSCSKSRKIASLIHLFDKTWFRYLLVCDQYQWIQYQCDLLRYLLSRYFAHL